MIYSVQQQLTDQFSPSQQHTINANTIPLLQQLRLPLPVVHQHVCVFSFSSFRLLPLEFLEQVQQLFENVQSHCLMHSSFATI